MQADSAAPTVVIPFHAGDQFSAQLLIENILSLDSGCDASLHFRLQFDGPRSSCKILDSIQRLHNRFRTEFVEDLPAVSIPPAFRENDPNATRMDDRQTVRAPEIKERILSWNRAVFGAIHSLDRFAIVEPDCLILKDGWAAEIFSEAERGLKYFPIFGHLKRGRIGGECIPTHYAGCSVYDGFALRNVITESVFQERYDNPWWPLRHNEPTELAGNCFWGPVFSGYDISFDYFLYAHLQRARHGHSRPLDWEVSSLPNREDLIFCDFRSTRTIDDILQNLFGKLPVLHGVKDDAGRHAVIKRARMGRLNPKYELSGKRLAAPIDRSAPSLKPQINSGPLGGIGLHNDRLITLGSLANRFKGERCFLIANGPSLKKTDLTLLKNEFTIGLNRIGLNLENMGFEPTALCCVNGHVLDQFRTDFEQSSSIKFLSDAAKPWIKNTWNTFFMGSISKAGYFEKDLRRQEWCEGWTVTYCALQLAYFLGFEEVILVGLDHSFKNSGDPNSAVVAQGEDENHFHPDYFGKGVTWQYPDLERSEQHYRIALQTFQEAGRRIFDATIGGCCTIFPKVKYEGCFGDSLLRSSPARPKVSVVIPLQNEETYIETAIQSVVSQGVEDIEILCVDDRSTDSSPDIVSKMSKADPRIKLISNAGAGVSAARNTGIAAAQGDYIGFLDADDIFLSDSLSLRLAKLEENPSWGVVHGVTFMVDPENRPLGTKVGLPRDVTFHEMKGMPASFNSILVRRNIATTALSFPAGVTNGEDWLAFARLTRQGHVSHFVEGAGATYRIHPQSTVVKDMDRHEEKLLPILDWIYSRDDSEIFAEEFRGGLDRNQLNEVIARRKASLMFWHIISGDAPAARKVARDINELGMWCVISWSSLEPSLRVSAARRLVVNLEQLPNCDAEVVERCMRVIADLSDEFLVEPLRDLFETFFRPAERGDIDYQPPPALTLDEVIRTLNIALGFSRESGAHVDETRVVSLVLEDSREPECIMLDVGAHFGTSASYFDALGWTIHCFEPDPANREKLVARFGEAANVTIDPRAVSDKPAKGMSFYASEESTGISTLHAFRETHREVARVDATTVAEIVAERNLTRIDFLKIDVEGYDFAVLKGVPWDRVMPEVIECEFEDAKTVPLGHDWRDIAEFLRGKGYTVYISEWHPIVRYGVSHDWRRVVPYPGVDIDKDAWGNFLAFRQDPGYDAVRAAFRSLVKTRTPPAASAGEKKAPADKSASAAAKAPSGQPVNAANGPPAFPAPAASSGADAPVSRRRDKRVAALTARLTSVEARLAEITAQLKQHLEN